MTEKMKSEDIGKIYQQYSSFNLPLLIEATRNVDLKIKDEHARKERIDRRVYNLLTLLLGLMTIVFAAAASEYIKHPWLLLIIELVLITSAMYSFQALKSNSYTEAGTFPSAWLSEDYIKGNGSVEQNNNILGFALAYKLQSQESNIRDSDASNSKRLKLLDRALLSIQLSMIPMIISLIIEIY
jgi:hypothetical protein